METNAGNYQNAEMQENSLAATTVCQSMRNGNYLNIIFPATEPGREKFEKPGNSFDWVRPAESIPSAVTLSHPQDYVKLNGTKSVRETSRIEISGDGLNPTSTIYPNFRLNPGGGISLTSVDLEAVNPPQLLTAAPPKRRGRKRRTHGTMSEPDERLEELRSEDEYFQTAESKQAQVLKAAKSLFSKRTRTLYHWMYPNAPKQQLKLAVADSWETLAFQEKEFYISQVLGRFGFSQSNLMVNPQLGGIQGIPPLPPPLPPLLSTNDETNKAVSSILFGEGASSSFVSQLAAAGDPPKQKRRLGRPPGSKNKKHKGTEAASAPPQEVVAEDTNQEEFQDDPELNREFQQFKWALHMTDKIKF